MFLSTMMKSPPCMHTLHILPNNIWNLQNLPISWKQWGINPSQCEDLMDFHVESCEKRHGRVQNFVVENGYGQQYKLANTFVSSKLCLCLHAFCLYQNLCMFQPSLLKCGTYLFDLVVVVKVYQGDLYNMYCDQTSKFAIDSFQSFKFT